MEQPSAASETFCPPVDLSNCDREPIHIPGHVQPYGALLAADPTSQIIRQVSDNCRAVLGLDADALLGKHISAILPAEMMAELERVQADIDSNPVLLGTYRNASDKLLNVIGHTYLGVLIIELEPSPQGIPSLSDFQQIIRTSSRRLRSATNLDEVAKMVAEVIRSINGFDRVMVYQFQSDDSGKVIAESKDESLGLESYLGMRYPATDIPKQTRSLFLKNIVRTIPDMSYAPSKLVPEINPDTGNPLDMTHAFLRGVSPIHIEYLQNMGVDGSLTLALQRAGELWGLVACHNYSTRYTSYSLRLACELLADTISLHLTKKENQLHLAYQERMEAVHAELILRLSESRDLPKTIAEGNPSLLDLIKADGVAIVDGKVRHSEGSVPSEARLLQIRDWLRQALPAGETIFHTSNIRRDSELAIDSDETFSGLLAVALGRYGYIVWFRKEQVQHVTWAGNPEKPAVPSPDGMALSPRRSFEVWRQDVYGECMPWLQVEVNASLAFGLTIKEFLLGKVEELDRLNTELHVINVALEKARDEAMSANRSKSLFFATMSHEFRTPLNAMIGYTEMLLEDARSNGADDQMQDLMRVQNAAKHMLLLVDDILDLAKIEAGEMHIEIARMDLLDVMWDAVGTVQWLVEKNGNRLDVTMPEELPDPIYGDSNRIRQIVLNLVGNAAKFTQNGTVGVKVETKAMVTDGTCIVITVSDTGKGIAPELLSHLFTPYTQDNSAAERHAGTGLGLSICKNLCHLMGGEIRVDSVVGEGSTFTVELPACKR